MKHLNFIIVEGNLVRDPDYRVTESGLPMCKFTIANNYDYKKNEQWSHNVNFINIVSWSKTAESCGHYLRKGNPVRVKGRVDQSYFKYDDGRSVNVIDVVAQSVEFLPQRKKTQSTEEELDALGQDVFSEGDENVA